MKNPKVPAFHFNTIEKIKLKKKLRRKSKYFEKKLK